MPTPTIELIQVPREDYEALEASLAVAEEYALDQERRIAQLEAQLSLLRTAVSYALQASARDTER